MRKEELRKQSLAHHKKEESVTVENDNKKKKKGNSVQGLGFVCTQMITNLYQQVKFHKRLTVQKRKVKRCIECTMVDLVFLVLDQGPIVKAVQNEEGNHFLKPETK